MTESVLMTFMAGFSRAGAFLFAMPIVGGSLVPAKVRVMAAVALGVAIASIRPGVGAHELPLILPAEILFGLAAGFVVRLVFAGAESGGQIIGLQLGLGMASFFDPASGEQAIVTRRFALVLASLTFLMMGGFRHAVRVLVVAPADVQTLTASVAIILSKSSEVMVAALRFAAPAMLAGLMTNVGMAFAARAAPSLNIFSVMLSALLIVGGFTLIVTAPALVEEMKGTTRRAVDALSGVGGL